MRIAPHPALRGMLLPLGLLCLGFLPGCGLTTGQRTAVKEFAAATTDFSTLAAGEFSKSREDVIEMNTSRVTLGDPDPRLQNKPLDDYFTVDAVKARVERAERAERVCRPALYPRDQFEPGRPEVRLRFIRRQPAEGEGRQSYGRPSRGDR